MNYPNISTLFRERARQYRGADCFYVREGNAWCGIGWERWEQESEELAAALIAAGLQRGAAVCVLMGNVPEWPIADIGIISAGGVSVGLYPTSSAEQCAYIINHSDAEFVLVDMAAQLEKILSVRSQLPRVKAFIVLDEKSVVGPKFSL